MVIPGYVKLFTLRGTAFRIHWSTPVVAFLAGGLYSGWTVIALAIIIPIHELGHAFFMRRYGMRVIAIDVHPFGGFCRGEGSTTPVRRAVIAWGGIVFQLLIGAACLVEGNKGFFGTLFAINLGIMILNALPLPFLDGWEAWRLFHPQNLRALFAGRRRAALRSRADELEAELARSLAREVEREGREKKDQRNLLN